MCSLIDFSQAENGDGLGIDMDGLGDTMRLKGANSHDPGHMTIGTLTIEAGPEGNLQYSPVKLYLASECDYSDGGFRTLPGVGETRTEVELWNDDDEDGNKYLTFSSLCPEVWHRHVFKNV